MKISYFRKSKFNLTNTQKNLKNNAVKTGFSIISETKLVDNAFMYQVCNTKDMANLLSIDKSITTLVPCSVFITSKNSETEIGILNPKLMLELPTNANVKEIIEKIQNKLINLINESAGQKALTPSKIILYSGLSCPYCKMESAWLKQNAIDFDEIYVDFNREKAEELVQKTGQMGVPVTELQYEDDSSEYIIGFDKQKLSNELGLS